MPLDAFLRHGILHKRIHLIRGANVIRNDPLKRRGIGSVPACPIRVAYFIDACFHTMRKFAAAFLKSPT
jgi:hypothetical protein